jgi:hypothetical protein
MLDRRTALLKVPRRLALAEKWSRWTQELRPQSRRRNQKPFSALTIYKRRPVTMCHPLWQHLFRELALLKRYVFPVAPNRHGGLSYMIRYGALRETSVNF